MASATSSEGTGPGRAVAAAKVSMTKGDFDLVKLLGVGGFGKVYLVRRTTGRDAGSLYALKAVKKPRGLINNGSPSTHLRHMLAERHMLEELEHPFLVKLVHAFQSTSKIYMVMDYLPGGDMWFVWLRRKGFLEDDARFYVGEIVLAFEYLHGRNIIFRDLKLENLLIDAIGHLKLTDFGFCTKLKDGLAGTRCGTSAYMAPEVKRSEKYGKEADWWSLGVVADQFMDYKRPFVDVQRDRPNEDIKYVPPRHLTNDAKCFLKKLLTKDPKRRLGYGHNGTAQVKIQRWFSWRPWDWDDRLLKRIEPPFFPSLSSADDTSHFDNRFTDVTDLNLDSESAGPDTLNSYAQEVFKGFSYTASFEECEAQDTSESAGEHSGGLSALEGVSESDSLEGGNWTASMEEDIWNASMEEGNWTASMEGDNATGSLEGDIWTGSLEGDILTASLERNNTTTSLEGDNWTASLERNITTASLERDIATASLERNITTASLERNITTASLEGDNATASLERDNATASLEGNKRTMRGQTSCDCGMALPGTFHGRACCRLKKKKKNSMKPPAKEPGYDN